MTQEVVIKQILPLQSGPKKDGTGTWQSRDIVLQAHDGTMYPDEFVVRVRGDKADEGVFEEGKVYLAEISFSTRTYEQRIYQDLWLRNLTLVAEQSKTENTNEDDPL